MNYSEEIGTRKATNTFPQALPPWSTVCWVFLATLGAIASSACAIDGWSSSPAGQPPRLPERAACTMTLEIDATDLPRQLLYGTTTIPTRGLVNADGKIALWYPKWMPGTHGPGGPVQNIAGVYVHDEHGAELTWTREPGEVYRINIDVPDGTSEVSVQIRYIANQPDANSRGVDSFGSELIGFVSTNTVLMYPGNVAVQDTVVHTSIHLPEEWKAASALHVAESDAIDGANVIKYEPVSLEEVVDSPIMVGRYMKTYDLVEEHMKDTVPPHRMHVFSEIEDVIDVPDDVVEAYQHMVTETALLFDSHPFDEFDILVATSDELGRNGLEHLRCTFNIVGSRTLQSLRRLDGWDQMLIPHEYVHSWCGKYRRPAGMITSNFHDPMDTDLLWVYEGLTQYLGWVIEARAGLLSFEEAEWDLFGNIRSARGRQGRDWRTLTDTGAASHILRAGSRNWSHLRRGQDYYNEGSLLWMEADALIRNETDGEKTLDDFCQAFFRFREGSGTTLGFDMDEIVATLNEVHEHDWRTFIEERVAEPRDTFGLGLLKELGYQLQYSNEPAEGPNNRSSDLLDARDSIGASFSSNGSVRTVMLDSPADKAGLGPDMRIVGVGDYVWSRERLIEAIADSVRTGTIDLMLVSGDKYVTKTIEYDGGPRFMHMVKSDDKNKRFENILKVRDDESKKKR